MALRESAISLKFEGGIESKMSPQAVPTTRLLALENAVFTRAISLTKRFGFSSLGLTVLGAIAPYAHPRGLGVRGDELVLFTDDSSYSYVEGAVAWDEIGGAASVKQSDRPLVKVIAGQTAGDYAAVGGIGLVAWLDSRGGVYFAVVEDGEGRITLPPTLASAIGYLPRCVRCGDKLALLWTDDDSGQISCIMIDPAQPHTYDATQYPRIVVEDLNLAAPGYDVAFLGDQHAGGRAAAAICWNAVGGIRLGVLDPSGVIGSPVTGWISPSTYVPAAAVVCGPTLALAPWKHDRVGVVWATAADAYAAEAVALASSTTISGLVPLGVAGVAALATTWRYGLGVLDVWLEHRNATPSLSTVDRRQANFAMVSATTPTLGTIRGACLASKAWTDCAELDATLGVHTAAVDRAYVALIHDVPLFGVVLIVRDDGLVVARTLPGNAGDAPAEGLSLPSVCDDTAGGRLFRWTAVYKSKLDSLNDDVFTEDGLRLVSLDFAAQDSHQTTYAGRTLYLGGACPMAYDGAGWVEAGLHYAPDWEDGAVFHVNSTRGGGGGGA